MTSDIDLRHVNTMSVLQLRFQSCRPLKAQAILLEKIAKMQSVYSSIQTGNNKTFSPMAKMMARGLNAKTRFLGHTYESTD